jgi:hypothetical protein
MTDFLLTAPALAAITLLCAFGCALAGAFVRDRLPADQLSKESQDVIRLGMGLIATMTALLLGMVTATRANRLRRAGRRAQDRRREHPDARSPSRALRGNDEADSRSPSKGRGVPAWQ